MVGGLLAGAAGGASVSILINAVDNFSPIFTKAEKALMGVGAALTGVGIVGALMTKNLIDTASSFESAFTGVRKTVELTEAEFGKLRQTFKDLSKEIPVSFQELSSIGEIAGQLGVEGVENLEKFTRTIADISATTSLTAEDAATSFARIFNIMQVSLTEVDKMGAAVVDLGNNFATTEPEIVSFAERIAGAGNIAGLTTQDILAIGTAMTSVGVEAEAGGTAVQKVLIGMNTAVVEGNDKLAIFAETAGLSAEEFTKAWEQDAGGAFSRFIIGLGEQGDKAIGTLDQLQLKDQRLVRAFLSLSNAGDLVTESFKTANKAWEENTALVTEAEKRYTTTESQVAILQNKFASLKDQMGQTLIPTFIKLVDVLGSVFGWLEQHPTLTKFAVAALAIGSALALVVGPLLILVALLPALSAGFALLSAASLPITGTVLAIAAAVAATVAGIVLLVKWLKKLKGEKEDAARDEFDRMNPNLNSSSSSIKAINLSPQTSTPVSSNNGSGNSYPTITLNGNITGTDPDDMAAAFADALDKQIRL